MPGRRLGKERSIVSIVAVFETRETAETEQWPWLRDLKHCSGAHAFLSALASTQGTFGAKTADFINFSLASDGKVVLPGLLYVPPEAKSDPSVPRPLILFLHGGGEKGTNNKSQINVNIDNLLAEAKRRGVYLYAPQSPGDWDNREITNQVMTMIDRAIAEYKVDKSRLYVTGLSSGGSPGTWNMLNRYPDRFAAGIPICVGAAPIPTSIPNGWSVMRSMSFIRATIGGRRSRQPNSWLTAFSRPRTRACQLIQTDAGSLTLFTLPASGTDLNYMEFPTGGHLIWATVYARPKSITGYSRITHQDRRPIEGCDTYWRRSKVLAVKNQRSADDARACLRLVAR